jgi:aminoglycoside 6'-N-acetyltransferase
MVVRIGFVQIIDPAREESHYWGDAPGGLRAIDIWIGEADAASSRSPFNP